MLLNLTFNLQLNRGNFTYIFFLSYSGYRNHIQKYTLQECVKFGQCNWPCDVDFLIGWRNKAAPRARIGSNWSRQPLGGVWKPSLKTQDTIKSLSYNLSWSSLSWKLACSALLTFSHAFCHHFLCSLSSMYSGLHASCDHNEKKSHLAFYILLFFYFSLFSFRWVSCAKLSLPTLCLHVRPQAPVQTSLQRLLNSKSISDFGETLFCKDGWQKGIP